MGFRFFKRLNILPGVTLNLSKSGGSVSVGPQGAKFTLGAQGARVTLGLPGTGLYYTTNFSLGKLGKLFGRSLESEATSAGTEAAPESQRAARQTAPVRTPAPASAHGDTLEARLETDITPDYFDRLSIPEEQKALTVGWQALAAGKERDALLQFQQAAHLADGAFLAGVLALKHGRPVEATQYLSTAAEKENELGKLLSRYGLAATMSLEVTEEVTAHVGPNIRGILLALAEAYQAQNREAEAIHCLERLQKLAPNDVVVKLSLVELLLDSAPGDHDVCQRVVQLTEDVENNTAVHAAILLYKAQALRSLGLLDAAADVLKAALARKKDRPDDLLRALRYERALVYEAQGQTRKARSELEKLYAEDPDYEDVASRLKM